MKREEKNQQTRQRILKCALEEFSKKGYGGSSVNTICSGEGISKGIIYHYFDTKDELYLACVEECFRSLTEYLEMNFCLEDKAPEAQLEAYFDARLSFFHLHPVFRRIFCDAVMIPPFSLREAVKERMAGFDAFNLDLLDRLISPLKLRQEISKTDVIDTFCHYQDYINARYQAEGLQEIDLKAHETSCHKALNILLYGVVEQG